MHDRSLVDQAFAQAGTAVEWFEPAALKVCIAA
jgi:hypothetical protein